MRRAARCARKLVYDGGGGRRGAPTNPDAVPPPLPGSVAAFPVPGHKRWWATPLTPLNVIRIKIQESDFSHEHPWKRSTGDASRDCSLEKNRGIKSHTE